MLSERVQVPACAHPSMLEDLAELAAEVQEYHWENVRSDRVVSKVRRQIPVSTWAERHRVIHTSSRPGRWRNDVTRYTQGLMDASFMDGVQTIVLMKSPQTGGTECIHNCVGYSLDRRPGPVLYVYPDEITARENARDRIIPMIKDSPRLSSLLSDDPDELSHLRIGLIHTTIYMAWSGSPSRLGNKPIRYLVLDELDKYQSSKREASSEQLAEKRVVTWGGKARIWKISTPTTPEGPIYQAWTGCQAQFLYAVPCPFCGVQQVMDFEHVRWPDDIRPADVFSQRAGRYECPHCHAMWTDSDRDYAVRQGAWTEKTSGMPLHDHISRHRPATIGFHVPAIISPFVSLSEIAQKMYELSKAPDLEAEKDFQNNYRGEPWQPDRDERTPAAMLRLCDDRPRGTVPGPLDGKPRVAALLAGVDTQLRYFRYVIRAIGFGDTGESWLVQEGVAPSFDALEQIMFRSGYLDAAGVRHNVRAVIIDAMGEQRRTAAVYEWAAKNRGMVFPSQGVHRMTGGTWKLSPVEWYPAVDGQRRKIPGGLQLFRVDSTFYKSMLSARLAIAPDDPGAFHLHANDGADQLGPYVKEMTAETWNAETGGGTWENANRRPNHAWDCEYLIQALADIMQIRHLTPEPEKPAPAPVMTAPPRPMSARERVSRALSSRRRW